MSPRAQRGVLWLALAAQGFGGVLGFALAPQAVFADIGADPLAALCLRLAAWSNLSMLVLAGAVLARDREGRWHRWLAVAWLAYHVPAGLEAGLAVAGDSVRLADPALGPAILHGVLTGLLIFAALPVSAPARSATA